MYVNNIKFCFPWGYCSLGFVGDPTAGAQALFLDVNTANPVAKVTNSNFKPLIQVDKLTCYLIRFTWILKVRLDHCKKSWSFLFKCSVSWPWFGHYLRTSMYLFFWWAPCCFDLLSAAEGQRSSNYLSCCCCLRPKT